MALSHRHGVSVELGDHLHAVADLGHPGRADEDCAQRVAEAAHVEVGLEAAHLAAECVALGADVEQVEVVAVEHDQAGAGAEDGGAAEDRLAQRTGEALALDPERHGRRLPAGDDDPVEPVEVGRGAHLAAFRAESGEHGAVRREVALEGEDADYHPRFWIRPPSPSAAISTPAIGAPSPCEARATRSGSSKCVVASTTAAAVRSGSSDLKIPDPTKTPSAPSCIMSAASAGVAIPPAEKLTTGSFPASATARTRSSGARSSLAAVGSSVASIA